MLIISPAVAAKFEEEALKDYLQHMHAWLIEQQRLAPFVSGLPHNFCYDSFRLARDCGMESEEDVASFARLRLVHGDDWLRSGPAQEILRSQRDSDLKIFQLEWLSGGEWDAEEEAED